MLARALNLLETADTFACIEFLNQQADIDQALQVYADLVLLFYNEKHDIHHMILLACAGIQHGLLSAQAAEDAVAYQRRSMAKGLAYNLASFTWPGWDEAGIQLDRGHLWIGLEAARTNPRLAEALEKGDLPLSRAYWVLGAQYMAAGDWPHARTAFAEAVRFAHLASQEGEALLAEGFGVLVDLLETPGVASAIAHLEKIKTALHQEEHGAFFSAQLETAQRVFA